MFFDNFFLTLRVSGKSLFLGFVLNLAVSLGAVPPKGVAMPFMSYGGSNLLVTFITGGVSMVIYFFVYKIIFPEGKSDDR